MPAVVTKKDQAAAAEIRKVVKNQLEDVKRAINAGTRSIALFELEDAAQRLKKLADILES
jgi:3-methyladenine DNA glycosylase AlkD